jgi:response regulator of citrate/malate metabolism
MEIPTINNEDIARLRQTARGNKTLESLATDLTFIDVYNTRIGFELLKDLISQHDKLLTIISDPEVEPTVAQRAEYKIVRSLIKTWTGRIERYLKSIGEIKEQTSTLQRKE